MLKRSHSIIDSFEKLRFSLSDLFWIWLSWDWKDEFLNFLYDWVCFHPFWFVELDWNASVLLFSQKLLNFPPWSNWLAQWQRVFVREHMFFQFQWCSMNQSYTATCFLNSFDHIFACIANLQLQGIVNLFNSLKIISKSYFSQYFNSIFNFFC